jgi:membrane-associated phospholipid phosphatase
MAIAADSLISPDLSSPEKWPCFEGLKNNRSRGSAVYTGCNFKWEVRRVKCLCCRFERLFRLFMRSYLRLRRCEIFCVALVALPLLLSACPTFAQTGNTNPPPAGQTPAPTSSGDAEPVDNPKYLIKHLAQDQVAIWTGPFKMKANDLKWVVPFAGITTGLIMSDRTASHEASRVSSFNGSKFSNVGLAIEGGSTIGFYLLGWRSGNRQLRETGVLSAEGMVDALAVDEVLKVVFRRQRPNEGSGAGRFFQSGSQQSFPSLHATASFAFASVLAHEYNGWLSQFLAYGGATAISLARVQGKQHFPSDVFVGGTLGYLIGRHVYRAHHDTDLDLADYGNFVHEPHPVSVSGAGSSYVELDSWIYPAVERLIALGVIHQPFLGLRPWTRTAVAQMLAEAQPLVEDNPEQSNEIVELYSLVKNEFSQELGLVEEGNINQSIRLESVYAGIYPISGTPLNDSYHFGQTIIDNFGRPYWQGFNAVSGFTSRAELGHFFFYTRGEYQKSPGAPAYPAAVRNAILQADDNCLVSGPCPQPASPAPAANQFRLLDTYAGFTALGNEISVGKQSLWWGTGESGAMIFSNNAEPAYMLRINRILPLHIPLVSRLLGPMRYDNFFAKLSGHNFPPNPFFYGDKISFQPTENLEFGFSRTAVFAGQGKTPLTFGSFWHSFISANDVPGNVKGTPKDPGARHGSFDFSYRLPFLRNWVTLYSDSVVHDEPSPLAAPRRAAIVPGIYISHFPRLSKLDLRVESGYTDIDSVSIPGQQGGHFLYWEGVYRDAYTNKGNLMGTWIGRDGKGTQVWTNYWLSSSSTIQLSYRNAKISQQFLNGGSQSDFAAGTRLRVRKDVELLTNFQYERWNMPLLATSRKSDFLSSIQLTFWPKNWIRTNNPK